MYPRLPTATRAFIRMHAPCAEWFSIRAVTDCTTPDKSSHDASTRIITAVRDSCTAPLIPSSIGKIKEQFNHHPSSKRLRRVDGVLVKPMFRDGTQWSDLSSAWSSRQP